VKGRAKWKAEVVTRLSVLIKLHTRRTERWACRKANYSFCNRISWLHPPPPKSPLHLYSSLFHSFIVTFRYGSRSKSSLFLASRTAGVAPPCSHRRLNGCSVSTFRLRAYIMTRLAISCVLNLNLFYKRLQPNATERLH
jgi:hypothetical protein